MGSEGRVGAGVYRMRIGDNGVADNKALGELRNRGQLGFIEFIERMKARVKISCSDN